MPSAQPGRGQRSHPSHFPEKDFKSLLDGLHQEFHPFGLYEEWLVLKIAECMWRLRRAARCESGSVRQSALWENRSSWEDRFENQHSMELLLEIWALDLAEKELRDSGSLSHENYQKVLPLVEEKRKRVQSERLVETEFDREEFLACITDRTSELSANRSNPGGPFGPLIFRILSNFEQSPSMPPL
jgi:hypothetical protein